MEIIKVYPNLCKFYGSVQKSLLLIYQYFFVCLVHDIYLNDEYYGENALHMAIANENKEFVRFILQEGKKVCYQVRFFL